MSVRPSFDLKEHEVEFNTAPLWLKILSSLAQILTLSLFSLDIVLKNGPLDLFLCFLFLMIIIKTNTILHELIHFKVFNACTGGSGKIHISMLGYSYFLADSDCPAPIFRIVLMGPLITIAVGGLLTSIVIFISTNLLVKEIFLTSLLINSIGSLSDLYVFVKLARYDRNWIVSDTMTHIKVKKLR